jgi:NYN domain
MRDSARANSAPAGGNPLITNVYVDGFNLYYGCLRHTPYRWLDLHALCSRLLPRHTINRIRYFSAIVSARPSDPSQPQRQQAYLRALQTLPCLTIHHGRYLSHAIRMPLAGPRPGGPTTVAVIKTEEKGSDVNLATYLLLDGCRQDCGTAVVISNDSDLKQPVELAQSQLGLRVGVVNPHPPGRRSRALRPTFFKQIRPKDLQLCQLPTVLRDARGVIHKPAGW